ncbi:uncharacterized protein EI97DRAFT_434628 [Westerdykella ornata]|uniref:Uncharacterized protein n=1 Tax=Westerdykella ornata TaxID=318751 RepID=A0A6A6JFL7_WESOR|nr:uncharacterized protein EI97DRAFT_434628 [Westerdykella ornata]KAF2275065.1 hypothetical protein EI97DRAFT_434628 [Westerdykella ornata]
MLRWRTNVFNVPDRSPDNTVQYGFACLITISGLVAVWWTRMRYDRENMSSSLENPRS